MIDLHCHILPAIDDGAVDLAESIEIARKNLRFGVRAIFATPHVMKGSYYSTGVQIRSMVDDLRLALRKASVDIPVHTGAEIYPEPTMPEDYKAGRLTPLGGTRFVLVEAPSSDLPPLFETLLFRLAVSGAWPILAHPERNPSLNQDIGRLVALVDRGIMLQVNVPSLTGGHGRKAQMAAERMARLGIIGFLGTDAHDTQVGSMRDALNQVMRLGGRDAVDAIAANEERLMAQVARAEAQSE